MTAVRQRPLPRRRVDPNAERAQRLVAVVLLFLIPLDVKVQSGVTIGLAAALVSLPVWVSTAWTSRTFRTITALVVVCLVSGLVLQRTASIDHQIVASQRTFDIAELLLLLVGVGILRWASSFLPLPVIGAVFAFGFLAHNALNPGPLGVGNPWKFVYSVPVTVLVLALVKSRPPGRGLIAVAVLGASGAAFDARFFFGTMLLTFGLLLWQRRPAAGTRPGSWVITTLLLAGGAAATYWVGSRLLVGGYLGAAAQLRSIAQINQSGSLILGGRPELAASTALFVHHPTGFGVGVVPSAHDVAIAKTGLYAINVQADTNYVENYLFAGRFELHSVLSDLWAYFGIPGIVLSLTLAFVIVRRVSIGISRAQIGALTIFAGLYSLFNLFFSPFESALPTLILSIGLCLAIDQSVPRDDAENSGPRHLADPPTRLSR